VLKSVETSYDIEFLKNMMNHLDLLDSDLRKSILNMKPYYYYNKPIQMPSYKVPYDGLVYISPLAPFMDVRHIQRTTYMSYSKPFKTTDILVGGLKKTTERLFFRNVTERGLDYVHIENLDPRVGMYIPNEASIVEGFYIPADYEGALDVFPPCSLKDRATFVITHCRYDKTRSSHTIEKGVGDQFGKYIKYPPDKSSLRDYLLSVPADKLQPIYNPKPVYNVLAFLNFLESHVPFNRSDNSYRDGVFTRNGEGIHLHVTYKSIVKIMRGVLAGAVHDMLMALEADRLVEKKTVPKFYSVVGLSGEVTVQYKVDRIYDKDLSLDEMRMIKKTYKRLFEQVERKETIILETPPCDFFLTGVFETDAGKIWRNERKNPILNEGDELVSQCVKLEQLFNRNVLLQQKQPP